MSQAIKLSSVAKEIGGRFYRKDFGKTWLCICFQTIEGGFFESKDEAMNHQDETKYSIINEIHNRSRINGKFEFLYEGDSFHNIWRQKNYPLYELKTIETSDNFVEGYEEIDVQVNYSAWRGLRRTNSDINIFDGTGVFGNTHFSVGTLNNRFGTLITSSSGASRSSFWMRVPYIFNKTCKIKARNALNNYLLFVFLVSK